MNVVEPVAIDRPACLNCGTTLVGEFCHGCGQKSRVRRTLRSLGHDLVQSIFNFEGKFFRTLPMLAWRPGELTRRYIDGQRARFLSPLTTFLFSVFLLATVLGNLPGKSLLDGLAQGLSNTAPKFAQAAGEVDRKLVAAAADRKRLAAAGRPTAVADKRIADLESEKLALAAVRSDRPTEVLAGTTVKSSIPGFDERWKRAKQNPDLLLYKIKESAYATSWLLVPMSLPFLWLLFPFSRRWRMYDHAIFTIYSLSFMSLLVIVLAVVAQLPLGAGWVAIPALAVPPIHLFRHLRGAYALRKRSALWRTILLLCVAALVLLFWVILLMLVGAA